MKKSVRADPGKTSASMATMKYRPGAPGGVRMTLPMDNMESNKWGFPNYPSGMLTKIGGPSKKHGGYEEEISPQRSLRRLPASIKDGGVD